MQFEGRTVPAECLNAESRHSIQPRCQNPAGEIEMMIDGVQGEQPS